MFIRGTGAWLPSRRGVDDAVRDGECDPRLPARTGLLSVSVSTGESAAEMAVVAARKALVTAGSTGDDVDVVLHADMYHQGQDLWPVASYIQRETVGNHCLAVEVRQMSNGGMAALDLAAAYLTAAADRRDALLTTADRFCLPGIDRWRTDPGSPYGDGGTAVVLSRRGGYARLRSVALLADSDLEPLHRGDDPFGPAPFSLRIPVDHAPARRRFVARHGPSYAVSRAVEGQRAVLKQALADADLELAEADWVILPHLGRRVLASCYLRRFDIEVTRTLWEWSRTVGHLGAGDQFASLDHLVRGGLARPGHRCVLVGFGAGYSWGAAVVEFIGTGCG